MFVTVTVSSTDLPSLTSPKGTRRSLIGGTESVTWMLATAAEAPVPLTDTVTDAEPGALLGMLKLPVKGPVNVGAKATVRVQDAEGAMVWFEQVSVFMEKGAASGVVEPMPPTVRLAVPVFCTVTV